MYDCSSDASFTCAQDGATVYMVCFFGSQKLPLIAGFRVLEWIDGVHPIWQLNIEPVAPGLFGKGRKSVGTGDKILSIAVGTRPDHVKHQIALGRLGICAFFGSHWTRINLLFGFLCRSKLAVKVKSVVHAFFGTAKDAGIVPSDSSYNSFIDGNNRSKIWENRAVGGIVI